MALKERPELEYRTTAIDRLRKGMPVPFSRVADTAKAIGIHPASLYYLLRGDHLPQPLTARKIHEYLDGLEALQVPQAVEEDSVTA